MKGERVTVTTAATLIVDGNDGSATYPRAASIKVPTGGQSVFIGGPDVAAATGYELEAGTSISLDVVGEDVYGIVAATTQAVHVIRRGS